MAIAAYEALIAIDRELSMRETAQLTRALVERRPPAGEELVPLPYARKFWKSAAPSVVSSAPILGLKRDVAAHGDSAWPVSIQRIVTTGRTGIVLSVDVVPPFGDVSDSWTWFRDWIAAIVLDAAVTYAAINGSGNQDARVAGEGLPPLRLLEELIPAAIAPWFFLDHKRIARAEISQAAALRELAAVKIDTGLIFTPSRDFVTPISKTFVDLYQAAARNSIEVFQGKLQ